MLGNFRRSIARILIRRLVAYWALHLFFSNFRRSKRFHINLTVMLRKLNSKIRNGIFQGIYRTNNILFDLLTKRLFVFYMSYILLLKKDA